MKPAEPYLVVFIINSVIQILHANINPACKCIQYQSTRRSSGVFYSPNHPEIYLPNQNCILYQFIGELDEIVELTFLEFDLKPPITSKQCTDYLRFYLNLKRPEVNERDEYQYELCGNITMIQKKHYSSGRSLIFEFHTDSVQGNYTGFRGRFRFLDKKSFTTEGCTKRSDSCTYDCYSSDSRKKGKFFSPHYPQDYKPGTKCRYIFIGLNNELVNIEFENIQLEAIDGSCSDSPDVIQVHDGMTEYSNVIAQYCNVLNNQKVYSKSSSLYVEMITDNKKQAQGFAATYEFVTKSSRSTTISPRLSSKAVTSPEHVQHPPGVATSPSTHISPPCNQHFYSNVAKNGTFSSPGYPKPYPANMDCTYIFHGQGRERVQIKFFSLNLKYDHGNSSDPASCDGVDSVIAAVNVNGQHMVLGTYCGNRIPPMLMSNSPTMSVGFISNNRAGDEGQGFYAQYRFVDNFGIEVGQQDSQEVCSFKFYSKKSRYGSFTSPNYPGLYPRETECHYYFYGETQERVEITFPFFDVEGIPTGCEEKTSSDYITFSNFKDTVDRLMERLCGETGRKKVVVSDNNFFRVTFKSNQIYDGYGFQASYQFKRKEPTGPEPGQQTLSSGRTHPCMTVTVLFLLTAALLST